MGEIVFPLFQKPCQYIFEVGRTCQSTCAYSDIEIMSIHQVYIGNAGLQLGVTFYYSPNVISLIESKLPKIFFL